MIFKNFYQSRFSAKQKNMGFPVLLEKNFYVQRKVKVIISLLKCNMHENMGVIRPQSGLLFY